MNTHIYQLFVLKVNCFQPTNKENSSLLFCHKLSNSFHFIHFKYCIAATNKKSQNKKKIGVITKRDLKQQSLHNSGLLLLKNLRNAISTFYFCLYVFFFPLNVYHSYLEEKSSYLSTELTLVHCLTVCILQLQLYKLFLD